MSKIVVWFVLFHLLINTNCKKHEKRSLIDRFTTNPLFHKFFHHHDDYDYDYAPTYYYHHHHSDDCDDFDDDNQVYQPHEEYGPPQNPPEVHPWSGTNIITEDPKVPEIQFIEDKLTESDNSIPDFHRNPWPQATEISVTNHAEESGGNLDHFVPDFHRNPWPQTSVATHGDLKPLEPVRIVENPSFVPDFHRNPWPQVGEFNAANLHDSRPQESIQIDAMSESIGDFHRNPWPQVSVATHSGLNPLEPVRIVENPDFHRNPWAQVAGIGVANLQDSNPQGTIEIERMGESFGDFHRNPWPVQTIYPQSAWPQVGATNYEVSPAVVPTSAVKSDQIEGLIDFRQGMPTFGTDFHRNPWPEAVTTNQATTNSLESADIGKMGQYVPDFHRNPWPVQVNLLEPTGAGPEIVTDVTNHVKFATIEDSRQDFHRNPWNQISAANGFGNSGEVTEIPSEVPDFDGNGNQISATNSEVPDFNKNPWTVQNSFVSIGEPTIIQTVEDPKSGDFFVPSRKHQMIQIPLERALVKSVMSPIFREVKPAKNLGKPKKVRVKVFKKKLIENEEENVPEPNLEHTIQFLNPKQEKLLGNSGGVDVSEYFRGDFGQKLDVSSFPLDLEHTKGVEANLDSYGNQLRVKRT